MRCCSGGCFRAAHSGRVAGGGDLRFASDAGRIGRVDHGAQECADGILFPARASGVATISRGKIAETGCSMRWRWWLYALAGEQDNGLHAAGGVAADAVVETGSDSRRRLAADRAFCSPGVGRGFDLDLVGALSPGNGRRHFHARNSGTPAGGGARVLVLSRETFLAGRPGL